LLRCGELRIGLVQLALVFGVLGIAEVVFVKALLVFLLALY